MPSIRTPRHLRTRLGPLEHNESREALSRQEAGRCAQRVVPRREAAPGKVRATVQAACPKRSGRGADVRGSIAALDLIRA